MSDRATHGDRGAIAQPADFLTGDWVMTRRIRFRRTATRGLLEGRASVRADGHQSTLNEQGLLRLDGREAFASQRYALTFHGRVVRVHFRNGAFFHEFELRERGCTAIYHCGSDQYVGTLSRARSRCLVAHLVRPRSAQGLRHAHALSQSGGTFADRENEPSVHVCASNRWRT